MRGNDWKDRTRNQKLAAVLYPNQTSEETRRQMAELSAEKESADCLAVASRQCKEIGVATWRISKEVKAKEKLDER